VSPELQKRGSLPPPSLPPTGQRYACVTLSCSYGNGRQAICAKAALLLGRCHVSCRLLEVCRDDYSMFRLPVGLSTAFLKFYAIGHNYSSRNAAIPIPITNYHRYTALRNKKICSQRYRTTPGATLSEASMHAPSCATPTSTSIEVKNLLILSPI